MSAASTLATSFGEWDDFIDKLRPIGSSALSLAWNPGDKQVRRELSRTLLTQLVHGYVGEMYADPDYPEFVSTLGLLLNVAAPVPDFMYQGTPIRGNGVYRISGKRGTSLFVDISALAGYWPKGSPDQRRLGTYDLDDLEITPKGEFDVVLSNERPPGYEGEWWHLDPRTQRLNARRASYDWQNEVDARLTIERLDVPARRARRSKEEIARRMDELIDWIRTAALWWLTHLDKHKAAGLINQLALQDYSGMGGPRGQVYLEGVYCLSPDEALLIETDVPEICRYWSFLVTDELFTTLDWMHRFSSINGHQARLDPDGRFRAVISAQDPGVPNWLDVGDYRTGLIQARWNNSSSAPVPKATTVKIGDVRKKFPNGTPLVTPDQRDKLLRQRRKGAQLRQVW